MSEVQTPTSVYIMHYSLPSELSPLRQWRWYVNSCTNKF